MNEFIINHGANLALIVRAITTVVILWQIIPLQIKEVNVKNGLKRLRIELLIAGLTLLLTNSFSMLLIITTKGTTPTNSIYLQIINSFAILIFAIILYLIYHEQYTPISREVHKKIDIREKRAKRYQVDKRKNNT